MADDHPDYCQETGSDGQQHENSADIAVKLRCFADIIAAHRL